MYGGNDEGDDIGFSRAEPLEKSIILFAVSAWSEGRRGGNQFGNGLRFPEEGEDVDEGRCNLRVELCCSLVTMAWC